MSCKIWRKDHVHWRQLVRCKVPYECGLHEWHYLQHFRLVRARRPWIGNTDVRRNRRVLLLNYVRDQLQRCALYLERQLFWVYAVVLFAVELNDLFSCIRLLLEFVIVKLQWFGVHMFEPLRFTILHAAVGLLLVGDLQWNKRIHFVRRRGPRVLHGNARMQFDGGVRLDGSTVQRASVSEKFDCGSGVLLGEVG